VSPQVRELCLTVTELANLHIGHLEKMRLNQSQLKSIRICQSLLASAMQTRDLSEALKQHESKLLELVSAEGFAYISAEERFTLGKAPSMSWIGQFIEWYREQDFDEIMVFDSLLDLYSGAEEVVDVASGIAVLRVQSIVDFYFLWFRPEVINTITWAGDPEKPMTFTAAGKRFTPRKTFEAWKQTLHGRGIPWLEEHHNALQELRYQIFETLLSREEHIVHLSEELHLLKKAVDASPNGIVMADPNQEDCPLVYVNKGFLELTGYAFHEVMGRNCRFLQGQDSEQPFLRDIREALQEPHKVTGILRNYRKDGTLFYNEITIGPVYSRSGDLIHFVGLQTDVTDRVEAQGRRDVLEAQLQQSQKTEVLDTLANGFARSLDQVLDPIGPVLSQVKNDLTAEMQSLDRSLDEAISNSDRAKQMIDQVLMLGADTPPQLASQDLTEILKEVAGQVMETLPDQVELDCSITGFLDVYADARQMQQVLLILAKNAIEAMPKGGRMTIRTLVRQAGEVAIEGVTPGMDYVGFSVADSGDGLGSVEASQVFEPFFSTKQDSHHLGLGLALARKIMNQHGGVIEVASQPGEGCTFSVLLPRHFENITVAPSSETELEKLSVLIVSAEKTNLEFLSQCVQALDLEHEIIPDPTAAVASLESGKVFDVAIIDTTFSSGAGLELIQDVNRVNPKQSVILCCGLGFDLDSVKGDQVNLLGILQKPFRFDTLKALLNQARVTSKPSQE
jgi:PAS domain S-box-containing protein